MKNIAVFVFWIVILSVITVKVLVPYYPVVAAIVIYLGAILGGIFVICVVLGAIFGVAGAVMKSLSK